MPSCPEVDVGLVGHGRKILEVGACKETGHDVAEHHRLAYPLEENGDESSKQQDKGEVGDESFYIHIR